MKILIDEKELLKKALDIGHISKKPTDTIRVLAKHYFNKKFEKDLVRSNIEDFMNKYWKNFKLIKWQRKINSIVNSVSRKGDYSLTEISGVEITKSELEKIESLENLDHEKLAFVLLVHCKLFNKKSKKENNWVNSKHDDIFMDAGFKIKPDVQGLMYYQLKIKDLISTSNIVDGGGINIKFIDESSEVLIKIKDFTNYIDEYLKWKGEIKSKKCINESCCERFIPTSNKQKYCTECSKKEKNRRRRSRYQISIK